MYVYFFILYVEFAILISVQGTNFSLLFTASAVERCGKLEVRFLGAHNKAHTPILK